MHVSILYRIFFTVLLLVMCCVDSGV